MTGDDTVMVIGGSSGMGLAVARRCLTAGARVVIAGRSAARLKAASEQLARLLPADCSRRQESCRTWWSPRPTCPTDRSAR